MSDNTRKARHRRKRESGQWENKRSADAPVRHKGRIAGSPSSRYQPKPVSWAFAARKLAKAGWSDRRIASKLGVSVDAVRAHLT